jgi:hypothetical protein
VQIILPLTLFFYFFEEVKGMANENNLKKGAKTQFRSGDEAVKKGQKGGIASGIKRKEQATYREMAKTILATKIKDKDILAQLEAFGISDDTIKALTLLGLIKASAEGSHNAFDRLLELAGEKNQSETEDVLTKLDKVLSGIDEVMHDEQA